MALVLEYAGRGNLRQCLEQHPGPGGMPTALRFKLSLDVVLGMAKLHRHTPLPIVHHDLKQENILVTMEYVAKVGDFGTSTGASSTTAGTLTAGKVHGGNQHL